MEVICNMHDTCLYSDICIHAKIHEKITDSFLNNCVFNTENDAAIVHGQKIICHCTSMRLRKYKLDKLNNL